MIKKILLGIFFLFILITLVGTILPGNTQASQSILIDAPADYVFDEINNLEKWSGWCYWMDTDPTMKVALSEKKTGLGANMNWTSEQHTDGSLIIVETITDVSLHIDATYDNDKTATIEFTLAPEGKGTNLTMHFNTQHGINPIKRMVGLMFLKPEINRSFDHNLRQIKNISEAKPKFSPAITEGVVSQFEYVGILGSLEGDVQELYPHLDSVFTRLLALLEKNQISSAGSAFCLYTDALHDHSTKPVLYAVPIATQKIIPEDLIQGTIADQHVVKGVHTGSYESIGNTHDEINKYINFKKLKHSGKPWEVFVSGVESDTDTLERIIEVYYPVTH